MHYAMVIRRGSEFLPLQKKPVSFSSDGTPGERQALHAAIRVAYGDSHPVAENPVIQMKNEQWDGVFMDLGEEDVIPNRAVLQICVKGSTYNCTLWMLLWLVSSVEGARREKEGEQTHGKPRRRPARARSYTDENPNSTPLKGKH